MSYDHEIRLSREGIDNVENLIRINEIDLAIRTGFGYHQLCRWRSQAKLLVQMGSDYHAFWKATGIAGCDDLAEYFKQTMIKKPQEDPLELLLNAVDGNMKEKVRIVCTLAGEKLYHPKKGEKRSFKMYRKHPFGQRSLRC